MKRLILAFALLCATSASAQQAVFSVPQQISGPYSSYTMSIPAIAKPCTLVLATRNQIPPFQDSAGNVWASASPYLWYTTSCSGVADTLGFSFQTPTYFQAVCDGYLGQWGLDKISSFASNTGTVATSPAISVSASELLVGFGENNVTNYPVIQAGSGFVLDGSANIFIEDGIVSTTASVSSSATYSYSVGWSQGIASFKLVTPPPPPVTLTLAGSLLFDDGTSVYTGSLNVQEQQTPTSGVGIGSINVDASGKVTGSIAVNTTWADANGNLTFSFGLPAIPNLLTEIVQASEFAQGSTGLTVNAVIFKKALVPKSFTLALTP